MFDLPRIAIVFCLIMASVLARGQGKRAREFGFIGGFSYYLGDLNQRHLSNLNPMAGIVLRKNYHNRLAWANHLLVTRISGADSTQKDPLLKNRNLSFRSNLVELGTSLEISYFDFKIGSKRDFATPYLFFGFSMFYFNPQARSGNEWRDLQPIGTEGQNLAGGKRYNLINFAIPLGAGFKLNTGRLCLTVFSSMRRTFTDHLDDVANRYPDITRFSAADAELVDRSLQPLRPDGTNTGLQRGNSNTRDWYNVTGVMLTFKTNKKITPCDALLR